MAQKSRSKKPAANHSEVVESRPLSALLSQVLVAFTVELDNEFERRMGDAGYVGARLSWVIWASLIQFLPEAGASVRELAARALASEESVKFELGCLERWRFVTLLPAEDKGATSYSVRTEKRDGWGSGRGIRLDWIARLTVKGEKAREIWLPLFAEVEERWQSRFGEAAIRSLRDHLQSVVSTVDVELPQTVPGDWLGVGPIPPRIAQSAGSPPLLTLLSQVLLAFTIEFERESRTSLALCANVLRVLGDGPVKVSEIPRLTGGSPERTTIGWRLKPFVSVEADPTGGRGKVARLTAPGLKAQQTYRRLVVEIEERWHKQFGGALIRDLRGTLLGFFEHREGRDLLAQGMAATFGVARTGGDAPALGRRKMAPAAVQRGRDLLAQTAAFVKDPAGALPHYPLWDMNRGFGP